MRLGLIALLIISTATAASPRSECIEEEFQDSIYNVTRLTGLQRKKNSRRFYTMPNLKGRVFFGLEHGHAYLMVDGKRYDGGALYLFPGKFNNKSTSVGRGHLFELLGLSPDKISELQSLQKYLDGVPAGTCINQVCNLLDQAGILAGNNPGIRPSELVRSILEEGFIDQATGKRIPVQIYSIGNTTLQKQYDFILNIEKGAGFVSAILTAAGLKIVYSHLEEDTP
jgi:hypothetical protein